MSASTPPERGRLARSCPKPAGRPRSAAGYRDVSSSFSGSRPDLRLHRIAPLLRARILLRDDPLFANSAGDGDPGEPVAIGPNSADIDFPHGHVVFSDRAPSPGSKVASVNLPSASVSPRPAGRRRRA